MTYISNAHLYRSVLVSRSMFFVRSSCIRLFCSTLKNYWFCCMHCCTVLSCIHKYMLRTNLGYVKVSLFERKINFYNFLLYVFFSSLVHLVLSCFPVFQFRNIWNADEFVLHANNVNACIRKISAHPSSFDCGCKIGRFLLPYAGQKKRRKCNKESY